ncbi:MAG: hypothetical protein M3Y49_16605 [Actinomycetota bacterium]|nr:hypothetical protein [Actinomycetota bacterium]
MDLFVFLQKLSEEGIQLEQINVPNHGPVIQHLTQNGAAILKYKGSNGRLRVSMLRVSMRKLDEQASTEMVPAHTFEHVEKLRAGEVVSVDIKLFPIGIRLNPG